ncbi:MAG: hypothetical protein WAT72_04580 [Microgenomates group bacterium]|jgi:hypothetical protein|nr:hypothetical protein [Candidatus Woesebacteria bacterium]MBP6883058.1 hypothetical protein [Candidatus Woesebacteria bacterium]QQR63865.1 MAG: hypothetical protein IPH70_05200 [Candidatus Roizmanbacteria bacterium]
MKKINALVLTAATYVTSYVSVFAAPADSDVMVDPVALGFSIPTIGDLLTFVIRAFFVVAGIMALLYLLLGALAWITSGGDKGGVEKARDKIQAAIVGVLMIVIVLAVVWTLENVVFQQKICFGISCPLTLPSLL